MAAPSYFDNQSGGYAPTSTAPASSGGWAAVLASLQPAAAKPAAASPALSMPVIVAGVCVVALVAYLVMR